MNHTKGKLYVKEGDLECNFIVFIKTLAPRKSPGAENNKFSMRVKNKLIKTVFFKASTMEIRTVDFVL